MPLNDEFREIGSDIIGAAFEVRNTAGRGLKEKYYQAALAYELEQRGYSVVREYLVPAIYKGKVIDNSYYADLLINDKVIIEVKAIGVMDERECRQLLTYLKLSGYKLGYLINFGVKDFSVGKSREPLPYRKGIYRFVNNI